MTLHSEPDFLPEVLTGTASLEPLQRAVGEIAVTLKAVGGTTALHRLRQAGCLKARLPRPIVDGWADIVTLNTSGGIAAGDRLDSVFELLPGSRATIATQAAERFYRAAPGSIAARVNTRIAVAEDAAAEWLPQETILFDRCAMDRRLEVELADSAWFVGVETLVFGRAAMGEQVQRAGVRDMIQVRRDGRPILHDAVRLDGAVDALLQHRTIAAGARTVATVVHVAIDAEARLESVRAALAGAPAESGASAWDGMLVARMMARDAASLRTAVITALHVIRDARPLPRTWLC